MKHDMTNAMPETQDSIIPCAKVRRWLMDNASFHRDLAKRAEDAKLRGKNKMHSDCAWAFEFVAEMAEAAESQIGSPKEQTTEPRHHQTPE